MKGELEEKYKEIKEKLELFSPTSKENRQKSISIIENDIPRTFPLLGLFKQGGELYEQLQNVLESFIFYQPLVGYVQGMSYIGAHFLLYMDELDSFIGFTNLINRNPILPFFKFDEIEIQKIYMLFKQAFKHNLMDLCYHFEDENIQPRSYLFEWFMTFYTRALDIDLVSRIWDLYFLDGVFVIYQAAIGILKICEKELMKADFEEILSILKNASKHCTSEEDFINIMYDVSVPDWLYHEIIQNGKESYKHLSATPSVLTTDTIFA